MITKDESIVNQVAAKIASDLALGTTSPEMLEATLSRFGVAYASVWESLKEIHSFDIPSVPQAQAQIGAAFAGTTEANASSYTPPAAVGALQVAGTQHGPLPAWLQTAATKAGVARVWDNRDKAEGTQRPHFKEAIDKADTSGREPVAFWPPKGR